MPAPRLSSRLLLPVGLILLVVVLGALQYRWLGQVSLAERAQLQRSLGQRLQEFTSDFDQDIGLVYAMLSIDYAAMGAPWEALHTHYTAWKAQARFPTIIKAVYLTQAGDGNGPRTLSQLDFDTPTGRPVDWPEALVGVRQSLDVDASQVSEAQARGDGRTRIVSITRASIFNAVPALVLPVANPPHVEKRVEAGSADRVADLLMTLTPLTSTAAVIVELDRDVLTGTMLPTVIERHFPSGDASPYGILVSDSSNTPIYSRGLDADVTQGRFRADLAASFFSTSQLELSARTARLGHVVAWEVGPLDSSEDDDPTVAAATAPNATFLRAPSAGNLSIFVQERKGNSLPALGESLVMATMGGWRIALRHQAGSLDAAVAQARQRNLLISFSILSVLAIGVALVVGNARRSERLAAQQMDFVATVSHELRTPLAVIRSAAQNLSAGVVDDPSQAKRYGDLIESEGRRLTDMVEEVLEFAGLSGQRRSLSLRPIDPASLAQEVVSASTQLIAEAGVHADVSVDEDVSWVMGDEEALRRAISNLLTNALKHGRDGGWVGVSVRRTERNGHDEVLIEVSDKGRGIAQADLDHIFEPFYRGRHALDQQIQGNGLGLSLVARIAESHGGTVTATSTEGQGTTVTLHLPAATPDQVSA